MAVPRANNEFDPADPEREDRRGEGNLRDERGIRDDKERWRLAWHYADMTDGEIESLAGESASLTEVARRALQSELRRRGLSIEIEDPAVAAAASTTTASPKRSRKLATLCRFRDMPEALLAKSVLESAGIECLLADANIIRTDWLWSNLVGGVKLRVLEEDLEEATRILDLDSPTEHSAMSAGEDFQPPSCPRCHSPEVSLGDLQDSKAEVNFSATARPAAGEPLWTCRSCGNQWRELEPTA
jgi:DNA-directed RNA polymerase subunit M/transcription elongation factor TFIIS